jgi:hypothetical protein
MSSIGELKAETTLAEIALNPEKHHHSHLFAVIIDVSEPQKSAENQNFNTRLKVIDPSFNYKAEVKASRLRFHKYVYINVYTETPEMGPKVKNVGDIIRLRRFRFKYTPTGELLGNEVKFSNWLVYSAYSAKNEHSISHKQFEKNIGRKLIPYEASRLSDLRNWSQTFFGNNSLMYVNWWTGFRETEEFKNKEFKNIDLILRVKRVETGRKNSLLFVDRDNRNFDLLLSDSPNLKEGDTIKLRCVDINVKKDKEVTRNIKITTHSSCLIIPNYFTDYKQFDKAVQEQKRSPAKSTKTVDPFINDYQVEETGQSKSSKSTPKKGPKGKEERLVTAVKKTYNTKKISTVEELQRVLAKADEHHGQRFSFRGHIEGFNTTNPHDIIKLMHVDDRKLFKLGDTLIHQKKLRAIFSFAMQLQDENGDAETPLNVYVQTGEYNSHLFTTWKLLPEFDDISAWQNVKENKLTEFKKRLEALKGPENVVRLVLELNITKKGNAFFKLIDTIFLA